MVLHLVLKWGLALAYLVLCLTLLLLFPVVLWPWLLGLYGVAVLWRWWQNHEAVGREMDIRPLTPWDVPDYDRFRERVAALASEMGLEREPLLAVTQDHDPNAFAVDGRVPMVIFTTGLLKLGLRDELLFVVGHELAHLRSHDGGPALIGSVWLDLIGRLVALFDYLSRRGSFPAVLALMILKPSLTLVSWLAGAVMAQRSRYNERLADLAGARAAGVSPGIQALQRLEVAQRELYGTPKQYAPWSPAWVLKRLHASHPPVEERIRLLREAVDSGEVRW